MVRRHKVKGHYRTVNGKKRYVKPHVRGSGTKKNIKEEERSQYWLFSKIDDPLEYWDEIGNRTSDKIHYDSSVRGISAKLTKSEIKKINKITKDAYNIVKSRY